MWPGVCSALTRQAADLELLVGEQVAGRAAARRRARAGWIRTSASGQRCLSCVELGDVVAVVVGEQDVGDVEVVLVGLGDQRLDGAAGVDEEGVAARLAGHEVGVRQPAVAHGTFEDHGWDTTRRCRAVAGCSPRSSRSAGSRGRASSTRASAPSGRRGSAPASPTSLVTVVTLLVTSLDDNEEGLEDNLGYILMFSAWGVGIVHSFLTRKPYLRRLAIIDDPALQAARTAEERRAYARELAQRNPAARPRGADRPQRAASTRAASSTSTTRRSRTSPTCRASTPTPRAGSSRCATASAASPRSRTSA